MTQKERERVSQTDRQTDRPTDRQGLSRRYGDQPIVVDVIHLSREHEREDEKQKQSEQRRARMIETEQLITKHRWTEDVDEAYERRCIMYWFRKREGERKRA